MLRGNLARGVYREYVDRVELAMRLTTDLQAVSADGQTASARGGSGLRRHPAGGEGVAPGRDIGRLDPLGPEDRADVGAVLVGVVQRLSGKN